MKGKKLVKKFLIVIGIIISAFIILIALSLIVNHFTPRPTALISRALDGGPEYSYNTKVKQTLKTLKDGTLYYKDIQYGNKYPNSYLDIYVPHENTQKLMPVVFSIHGGGYVTGDKVKNSASGSFNKEILKNGYILVQINYALAPEYTYPTPIIQSNEALKYIAEHGKKYNIDTAKIIITGDSAGGQLAGQLTNIQVNQSYADEVGIKAVIPKESIKAVVLNSALVDITRMDKIDNSTANYLFNAFARAYFGTNNWRNTKEAKQAKVYSNVNKDFPPTFITDGNTSTFTEQNKDLAKELKQIHVDVELNLYTKSEAILQHEYQFNLHCKQAQDNMQKELNFIQKHL